MVIPGANNGGNNTNDYYYPGRSIGTIKAADYWEGDFHFPEVVLELDDANTVFANICLYVGSLKGLEGK